MIDLWSHWNRVDDCMVNKYGCLTLQNISVNIIFTAFIFHYEFQ